MQLLLMLSVNLNNLLLLQYCRVEFIFKFKYKAYDHSQKQN